MKKHAIIGTNKQNKILLFLFFFPPHLSVSPPSKLFFSFSNIFLNWDLLIQLFSSFLCGFNIFNHLNIIQYHWLIWVFHVIFGIYSGTKLCSPICSATFKLNVFLKEPEVKQKYKIQNIHTGSTPTAPLLSVITSGILVKVSRAAD